MKERHGLADGTESSMEAMWEREGGGGRGQDGREKGRGGGEEKRLRRDGVGGGWRWDGVGGGWRWEVAVVEEWGVGGGGGITPLTCQALELGNMSRRRGVTILRGVLRRPHTCSGFCSALVWVVITEDAGPPSIMSHTL